MSEVPGSEMHYIVISLGPLLLVLLRYRQECLWERQQQWQCALNMGTGEGARLLAAGPKEGGVGHPSWDRFFCVWDGVCLCLYVMSREPRACEHCKTLGDSAGSFFCVCSREPRACKNCKPLGDSAVIRCVICCFVSCFVRRRVGRKGGEEETHIAMVVLLSIYYSITTPITKASSKKNFSERSPGFRVGGQPLSALYECLH